MSGQVNVRNTYYVMDTPLVLQLIGMKPLPLEIDGSKIEHILAHDGMSLDVLKSLPAAISNPLMVLDSYANRKVVVVELHDLNDATIIVPIDVDQRRGHTIVNILNNAYGKNPREKNPDGSWTQKKGTDFSWFVRENIEKGRVLYIDIEKSTQWTRSDRGDSPNGGNSLNALSNFIISEDFQKVKTRSDLERFTKEKEEEKNMSTYLDRDTFFKDKEDGVNLITNDSWFKFDEKWLHDWVEEQGRWESFEHFEVTYTDDDVYSAKFDAEEAGLTIKETLTEEGTRKYGDTEIQGWVENVMYQEMSRIGEEKGAVITDTTADVYHQEISDSLTVAEESLEDNAAKELRGIADDLHTSMKNVEEAEQTCGADQETWDGYATRHENIVRRIEAAGDARSEGKSEEECSDALIDAQESLREGTAYMEERCAAILRREKEYQEELAGLRARIEELEREREVRAQLPEELARCLAASTEFLAAVEDLRREAKAQPRIIASEMYSTSRRAVKDAYYSVKLAPTKVKNYLRQRAQKAIDGVLHSVASVFDEGIAALEQRRAGILRKSHEMQSASEFYRDALEEALKDSKAERSMETERTIARSMAKAGFGAYAIEKVLRAESPYRKEMEQGDAKNIAKDAVQETKEQREEKTR